MTRRQNVVISGHETFRRDVFSLYFTAEKTAIGRILVSLASASLSLRFPMAFIRIHVTPHDTGASFVKRAFLRQIYCPFTALAGVCVIVE